MWQIVKTYLKQKFFVLHRALMILQNKPFVMFLKKFMAMKTAFLTGYGNSLFDSYYPGLVDIFLFLGRHVKGNVKLNTSSVKTKYREYQSLSILSLLFYTFKYTPFRFKFRMNSLSTLFSKLG